MSVMDRWQQIAIEIGQSVRGLVNTQEMIGTDDETGYILMFFNAKRNQGKSTLVSSEMDKTVLKRLLKVAIRNLDRGVVVDPPKHAN